MSLIICGNNNRYNLYSTITDSFYYESSIDINQLRIFIEDTYGKVGLDRLDDRLNRVHNKGHSSLFGCSLEEFLSLNRAGDKENHLTYNECIKKFLS